MLLTEAMLDFSCRRFQVLRTGYGPLQSDSFRHTCLTRRRTHSRIYGRRSMDLRELVSALLNGDLLTARQCVIDARRENVVWAYVEQPHDLDEQQLPVAAGVVELLASRAGQQPPTWTI